MLLGDHDYTAHHSLTSVFRFGASYLSHIVIDEQLATGIYHMTGHMTIWASVADNMLGCVSLLRTCV